MTTEMVVIIQNRGKNVIYGKRSADNIRVKKWRR